MPDPAETMVGLINAFSTHNEAGMRAPLAEDITAYVTSADGGVEQVHGRDNYLQRLLALKAPTFSATVTQSVHVAPDQAMVMVEIRAERKGRTLHNFAVVLATVQRDQIVELWMVEALPAYSDAFWR